MIKRTSNRELCVSLFESIQMKSKKSRYFGFYSATDKNDRS